MTLKLSLTNITRGKYGGIRLILILLYCRLKYLMFLFPVLAMALRQYNNRDKMQNSHVAGYRRAQNRRSV